MTYDPLDGTDEEIDAAIDAKTGVEKIDLMWRVIAFQRVNIGALERTYRAAKNTLDGMADVLKQHRDIMEAHGITLPQYDNASVANAALISKQMTILDRETTDG
jgi:hypothetical protein